MALTKEAVEAALKNLIDPNTQKDFVTSKEVKNINVDGDTVSLEIELGYPANSQLNAIRNLVVGAVKAVPVSCSAYSPCATCCGELRPTGKVPGTASVANSLPKPD